VITALPMVFMMVMTLWALVLIFRPWLQKLAGAPVPATAAEGGAAIVLFVLAILLLVEAGRILVRPRRSPEADVVVS